MLRSLWWYWAGTSKRQRKAFKLISYILVSLLILAVPALFVIAS